MARAPDEDGGAVADPPPFPTSLCHACAAPPRYVRTASSTFILCPVLPSKYPPQPVVRCAAFRPREDAGPAARE